MKKSTKRWAAGTIIAAGAGYLAGILTAPKSGRETRQDIAKKAIRAKAEAEKNLKKLHSELHTLTEKASLRLAKASSTVRVQLTSLIKRASEAKEKAREILSTLHDGDAPDKDLEAAVKQTKEAIAHLKAFLKSDNAKKT